MVAAAACDDPEPTATPTTAPTATATATAPPTITPTTEPSPTPTPLSVEAVVEATAASMRALESAHIEGHITMTARVTGEEEGTVEMSMVGDYQAPDRTRLSVSLTIEGNDFEADYTSIANETYIQVPGADIWQVSDSSDGLDLRETLRFDPEGVENLALIGEEELEGEKVYHPRGFVASDAGGLLNSVPGGLAGMTPLGEVVVEVEFWIGVGDFLVRRTIQNIDIELSSNVIEDGKLHLELDMRLSDYGEPVDIQAPDVESALGTGPDYSEATPIPAPTATPFVAAAPTLVPKRTCMPQPAQQLTPEQEQAIDSLPWRQDRPGSIEALRGLAMHSPEGFKALMQRFGVLLQRFGDNGVHGTLLPFYEAIALCDEAAAISILQMPFLSGASGHFDGGYLDLGGFHVLDSISRLAMFDLDGLQSVLSHPDLRDGITSAQAAFVVLLALEQDNPEAAAAIKALPWVQDGITYTPESDDSLLHRNFEEYENESVLALAEMARRSSESFWALLDKSWVRDGYTSSEYQVLSELFGLASRDDETTARLLGMPFLESFDKWESLHFMVQVLDDLARDHPSGFRRVLSSPALAGGITSDQKATIALLDLKERNPDAASAMEALPYIQDGISPSEQDGVLATWRAALESDPVFRTLLTKSWVRDGLTPDESLVVHGLANIAGETLAHRDEAAALLIVDMPFLETIDGLDFQVLGSLALLIWVWESDRGYLQHVLAHPSLRDGITDDWTNVVAVLHRVVERRPELLDVLLDPEQTIVKERSITLPLRGDVALSVIWPGDGGTDALASRTMDLLEHVVRTQEEFMGVPYPERYAIVLIADVARGRGGGGADSIITIDPQYYEDYALIAHEAAHTYWPFPPSWFQEGGASFLDSISTKARTGARLPEPVDSCSPIDNIAELVRLPHETKNDFQICNYTLGEGMFLDLYLSLGDEAFRQGFANLYLQLRDGTLRDECAGIDRSACHIKAAFVTGATPENAAIAEAVITRRYYGASP